jgi:hypothetical protein
MAIALSHRAVMKNVASVIGSDDVDCSTLTHSNRHKFGTPAGDAKYDPSQTPLTMQPYLVLQPGKFKCANELGKTHSCHFSATSVAA